MRAELTKLSVKRKFIVLLTLVLWFSNKIPAFASGTHSLQTKSEFSFFPYECCLLLDITGIDFEKERSCHIMNAKVSQVLLGKFQQGQSIKLCFTSSINQLFHAEKLDELVGKKEVLAFNLLDHGNDKNIFLIEHEFLPLKSQPISQQNIMELRRKIPKPYFPYRSCLIVTLVGLQNKPNETILKMRIQKVLSKDQKFPIEDGSVVSKKIMTEVCPRMQHYDFRLGEEIFARIDTTALSSSSLSKLNRNSVGKTFVLCWNPNLESASKPVKSFSTTESLSLIPRENLKANDLSQFEAKAREKSTHLSALSKQLENYIEKRWTLNRVHEFMRHPELREVAPIRHIDLSREAVLGGQIYSEHENEIGKLIWYTSLKGGMPINDYLISSTDRKGHKWLLEAKKFEIEQLTDQDFEKDLLFLIVHRCYQAYVQVRWNEPFELRLSLPIKITKIVKNENNKNKTFFCELGKGKMLSADVDSEYRLNNILIDGKKDADWDEAYNKRVENMDTLWDGWVKTKNSKGN
jgi:hypothetical protein